MKIKPCRYCGGSAEVTVIRFDHEFNFGPGGFDESCVACRGCGLSGPRFSIADVQLPRVTRKYTGSLGGFPVPLEEYEPQDTDAEIRRLAVDAWNKLMSDGNG